MAIQTLNTIKNWFKTNLKPTQSQFWDTWDSFRHKNEKIPMGDLDGIDELLQDKIEREVFENHLTDPNAHAELINKKLDKGGYNGTGKNLDDRITAIENPDRVLKFGVLTLSGLNLTITSNTFAWIVNKLQFLTPASYAKTLTAAASGMYRTDIVVGNQSGTYEVITGFEAVTGTAAVEPSPPAGTIKLGFISLLGNTVVNSGSTPAIEKPTIVDADRIVIDDSETSFAKKSVKFLNFKAALKTYFDTIYQSFMGISTVTGTTYQLLLTDNGKKIMFTSATAVALTIPTNTVVALPIGARIKITQQGDGVITFTTTGLTIVSTSPLYTIKGQTVTLEKTAVNTWTIEGNNLNGEIRLSAYPNTRNDGQIPTNRVLSADTNGNLKMFTIATFPAPYMEILIPDSTLPSTTTNFTIKGAFFTPSMTVSIVGQTINYIVFQSDNLIKVNVTTGATEGMFAVTLNNGISATYLNALSIVLGTVYAPIVTEWEAPTGVLDISAGDKAKVITYESRGTNRWNKTLNISKNFYLRFQIAKTPTGYSANNEYNDDHIVLVKSSDNTKAFSMYLNRQVGGNITMIYWCPTYGWGNTGNNYGSIIGASGANSSQNMDNMCLKTYDFRWINGVMYIYVDNILKNTLVDVPNENLKLKVSTKTFDIINIKYIELP